MLHTLALCAVFIGLIYVYLAWNLNYWKKRGVPGPPGYLVAGSFPQAFFQRKNLVYTVDEVYKRFRHETPFFGVFASRQPDLIISDPEYVKHFFITNFRNFQDTQFGSIVDKTSDPLLSRNPFMLSGDEWKDKRSEVTPAFTNSRLKSMYPIMEHVAKKLTNYMQMKLVTKPDGFDAKDLAANFTADVVSNCIFGIDSLALSGEHSVVREMGSSIFQFTYSIILYLACVQFLPIVSRFYKLTFVPKRVERFFEKLTRDAIQLRTEGKVKRDDFLNYLLQLREKKSISDLDITAHSMTFFLDGFETSSYVIANILNRLADNPATQTKLRDEINASVEPGQDISFEKINDMQYLDQVFNETLRINPILGFSSRICTEPLELSDYNRKKFTVEKGISVHIPVYSIHHDPEYYPDPEVFDPERFSEQNGGLKAYKDKGVFLAFGEGPRICLGMKFGTLQVKVAIVELVRHYMLKVNPKTQSTPVFDPSNFLLSQIGGIWIDFVPIGV